MMRGKALFAGLVVLLGAFTLPAEWPLRWRMLESGHFRLYHPARLAGEAARFLAALERTRPLAVRLTGNDRGRTSVVLEDWGLSANGLTDPVFARIELGLRPPSFAPGEAVADWPAEVGLHETVHLFHLTRAEGAARVLTALFGDLAAPSIYAPLWLSEGVAVSGESMLSATQGRLHDGRLSAYLDERRNGGGLPSPAWVTGEPLAFPADQAYLYGGGFVAYLAGRFGEGQVTRFLGANAARPLALLSPLLPALGFERSARRVFGSSLQALWRQWRGEGAGGTGSAGTGGHPVPAMDTRPASWLPGPLAVTPGGLLVAGSLPQKVAFQRVRWRHRLIEMDEAGRQRTVARFTSPVLRLAVAGRRAFLVVRELRAGYANLALSGAGGVGELRELDLPSGRHHRLLAGLIRGLAVAGDGRLLFSRDLPSGGSEVVLLDPKTLRQAVIWRGAGFIDELLPRGSEIVVLGRLEGEPWAISVLTPGQTSLRPLLAGGLPRGHLAADGEGVLFTQGDGLGYRILRLDPATGALALFDADGTRCRPVAGASGAWIGCWRLTTEGWRVERLPPRWRAMANPAETEPAGVPPGETGSLRSRPPFLLSSLVPRARVPYAEWQSDRHALGLWLLGADPPGFFQYSARLGWDLKNRQADLALTVGTARLSPLRLELWGERTAWHRRWGILALLPLRPRRGAGLTGFDLAMGASRLSYPRSTWEVTPRLSTRWSWPGLALDASLRARWEPGTGEPPGLYLTASGLLPLPVGAFSLTLRAADDPGLADREMLPPVRGEPWGAPPGRALVAFADARLPLARIRKGLWNPALFIEDLWAGVFCDFQGRPGWAPVWAAGFEAALETRLLFTVPALLGVRLATGPGKRWRGSLFATLGILPFLGGSRGPEAARER